MTIAKISLLLLASFFFFTAVAQKGKTNKKPKAKEEEIEKPPPPPQEELKEVRIDTTGVYLLPQPERNRMAGMSFNMPDTSQVPADELTAELRKILNFTGALDIGVQFSKLMNSDNEEERNGLPKEFYKRMYEEMSKGDTKKLFENEIIKIYRKYYTLEDAKALMAFYETPTGRKTLIALPKILDESYKAGAEIGKVLGMKIYDDLIKEGILK